jgi:two-component system nitrate/nitrite response regulator NarL
MTVHPHCTQRDKIAVMIVEDHRTMLWGLQRLIDDGDTGMRVIATATNAHEARQHIVACTPDVVLLDLDLGGSCSLELLPALLANGNSRVLILTGSRDEALLDSAVRAGARGVLHKDASAESVLKAIEKVHSGELWIDHAALTRLFGQLTAHVRPLNAAPEEKKRESLTARELQIIQAVVVGNGALNRVLAENLFISEHTLRNHLVSIYRKLGVKNRLELYVYAVKHQLGEESSAHFTPAGYPF